MRSARLIGVVIACSIAFLAAVLSAQTTDQLARFTDAVRLYQAGDFDRATASVMGWSQRDLERVGRQVVASADPRLAEAAVVFQTELAWSTMRQGSLQALRTAASHLVVAEERVLSRRAGIQLEFQQRWYAVAASLFLASTNPGGARPFLERGLKLSAFGTARLHMLDGAVEELVAHLDIPECVGPICDSRLSAWLAYAEAKHRRALGFDPDLTEARLRLGRVLFLRNRLDEARRELDAVTNHTDDSRLLYLAHLFLGGLHAFENDLPGARREYEEALTAAPDYPTAYIALGFVEQMSGQEAKARELLATAASLQTTAASDPWRRYQNGGLDMDSLQWLREHVRR